MTIKIEITNTPDTNAIAAIHDACFPKSWSSVAIRDLLNVEGTMAFLAGNAAFGLLRHIAGEAEILTLAVLPEQRKKGMGEALVHAMVLWAQEQHIRSMFLEVDECNEVARKLYEKKGFLVISKRNEYYQNTDGTLSHALVMKLILS